MNKCSEFAPAGAGFASWQVGVVLCESEWFQFETVSRSILKLVLGPCFFWCALWNALLTLRWACYIFGMKKFLAAALLLMVFAAPAFAAGRHHHRHHHHHHAHA